MSYPSYPRPGYPSEPSHSGYPGQPPTPGYPSQSPSYPGHHQQGSFSGGPPPPAAPPLQAQPGASNLPTTGQVEGVMFRIDHRDSNSMLYLRLQPGAEVKAKPGSMVAMDATVKIKGKMKFSVKKMITGVNISESIFTGPGEVMVAPETWGDIVPIHLDGRTEWRVGKDAYLACTPGITRTAKSQGIGATLFSGEGLFVHNVVGAGMMWVTSLGAIVSRTLQPGEQWIVDNGHLVAWTANYKIERIDAGGFFSASHTDEGVVCRFTGPGIVYIQSRNPETLGHWIREQLPSESR